MKEECTIKKVIGAFYKTQMHKYTVSQDDK